MLHGHGNVEMDTTRDKILKIHTTCVSDTFRTQHGSMIKVSVLATIVGLTIQLKNDQSQLNCCPWVKNHTQCLSV